MGPTLPTKYRVILWVALISPFLYVLLLPPLYHAGELMVGRLHAPFSLRAHPHLARMYFEVDDVMRGALRVSAKPYWMLAENSPLPLEMAFFEYDAWWGHKVRDQAG
jgi:hypothetical protein